jgi:hypothetical protein
MTQKNHLDDEIMAARLAEAEKGIWISGEAMTRWIESWDTENELPPPEPDIFEAPKIKSNRPTQ